jgi:hypothetical protein
LFDDIAPRIDLGLELGALPLEVLDCLVRLTQLFLDAGLLHLTLHHRCSRIIANAVARITAIIQSRRIAPKAKKISPIIFSVLSGDGILTAPSPP